MINLSGLSATYPGYEAAEKLRADTDKVNADTAAKTQKNQTEQRDAAIKLLGANVLGAALSGRPGTLGGGPQPPAPGQASMPAAPPQPPSAPPGGAAAAAQPPAPVAPPRPIPPPAVAPAPQSDAGPVKTGLQPMIARIVQTAPGVANHPEVLLAALKHAKDLGLLDKDAEAEVDDIHTKHTAQRISAAQGHLDALKGASGAPPAAVAPASPAAPPPPTATNPQTGAKVQWDGKAWQPLTN